MDPLQAKAMKSMAGGASKGKSNGRKKATKKKKKRAAATQHAGQSSAAESPASRDPPARTSSLRTGKYAESPRETPTPPSRESKPPTTGESKPRGRCCPSPFAWLLAWCGLERRKRVDDFVVFDDDAALERSLLWSQEGGHPPAEEYLKFVPGHERDLTEHAANLVLPKPAEDRYDY